ncbi:hypothetical protein CTAYLR_001080 [Chrysophaeum taylorii]|uniref:AAA+ ATPase domain-containing protein n=1 Tax=Chrysophaeum taylorii TaxID=2483200 RepID=A0AAD7UHT5_9STRA|nr:hypothetical protein CTAYLR_001080 [Chrysophaeum taylorii]
MQHHHKGAGAGAAGFTNKARVASHVEAVAECRAWVASRATAAMVGRRLRNVYVRAGAVARFESLGEIVPRIRIRATTPGGVVAIRVATRVSVVCEALEEESAPRLLEDDESLVETAASVTLRELRGSGPSTVLLHGVAGVGKSAAAVVASRGVRCEVLNLEDAARSSRGWDELTALFERAYDARRSTTIVLDNLEALGAVPKLATPADEKRLALATRLGRLARGAKRNSSVFVVGTTRRVDDLSAPLADAFEVRMKVTPPTRAERRDFVEKLLREASSPDVLDTIATRAVGYVAADLRKACEVAVRYAERRRQKNEGVVVVTTRDAMAALEDVPASCLVGLRATVPKTRWEDIGGQREAKRRLKQAVEWPITKAHLFRKFEIEAARGVLMHGPPGCSKTMLARACATESEAAFISLSGADVYSPYLGEAEATVRRAFDAAETASPAILFFDEIEALVTNRATNPDANAAENRVLATFLECMDGVAGPREGVVTIGATNRPREIDAALLRPGRLETRIYVALPDRADRLEILRIHVRKYNLADDVDLDDIASKTRGYSGADLAFLCKEAANSRPRTFVDDDLDSADPTSLRARDFRFALRNSRRTYDLTRAQHLLKSSPF